MIIHPHLESALLAVFSANIPVMEIYDNSTFNARKKDDGTKVTDGDIAAHNEIVKVLNGTGITIISEENYQEHSVTHTGKFWLIDPIDGTREYVSKGDHFSINIALIENSRPTVSVMYFPALYTLYFAVKGEGAYKVEGVSCFENVYDSAGTIQRLPLKIDKPRPYTILIRKFSNPSSMAALGTNSHIKSIKRIQPDAVVESYEASIKFCMVAEGDADYYFHAKGIKEWDVACGDLLVTESGGKVVLKDSQQQVEYGKSETMTLPAIQNFRKNHPLSTP